MFYLRQRLEDPTKSYPLSVTIIIKITDDFMYAMYCSLKDEEPR